jgi:YD repeat-containing protein
VDSKIAFIKRTNESPKTNLGFEYDALGNRIAKHTYTDNTFSVIEKSTYYVRDASGNTLLVSSWQERSDGLEMTIPQRSIAGATYEYKTDGLSRVFLRDLQMKV